MDAALRPLLGMGKRLEVQITIGIVRATSMCQSMVKKSIPLMMAQLEWKLQNAIKSMFRYVGVINV